MKRIKVAKENEKAVEAALAAVNGKATAHTITSFEAVAAYAKQAENRLTGSALPKAERIGARAVCWPAGPGAKAYGYAARSTGIMLERGSEAWFLVEIQARDVFPKQGEKIEVSITEAQAETIKRKALEIYTILQSQQIETAA